MKNRFPQPRIILKTKTNKGDVWGGNPKKKKNFSRIMNYEQTILYKSLEARDETAITQCIRYNYRRWDTGEHSKYRAATLLSW